MNGIIVIRKAHPADLPSLPDIERRASALFAGHDVEAGVLADVTSLTCFERAEAEGLLWVAIARGNTAIGFAFAEIIDGNVHLDELDVVPEYGRRGIGAALVHEVCACAERRGVGAVTLTTFRDIAWNAPFYAKLGFTALPESAWTPVLARTVAEEAAAGLDPARRIVMRREIVGSRRDARTPLHTGDAHSNPNVEIVRAWVTALDGGDADAVCALYDEELRYFVVGAWPLGGHFDRTYMERNCRDVFTVFPQGLRFTTERIVAEDDWVCLEMRSEGVHVSGRTYRNHYTYWFEIRDGKIVQLKEWLDTLHANDVLCGPAAAIDFAERRK